MATPYLLAFAWLAMQRNDPVRAGELVAIAELYDSSTAIALIHLLAALGGWTDETWQAERDAAIATYLSPAHEFAVEQGPVMLDEELRRWEDFPSAGRT